MFETFCCKVLAGIDTGKLPDTIRDRAIVIPLERKKREEQVERLRVRDIEAQVENLQKRLEEWAAHHVEQLEQVRPAAIMEISDRLDEAWEPLIAIAELAGGDWPARARAAAVALAKGGEDAGEEDHGELLLRALKEIFGEREVMPSSDICGKLNEEEELPFGSYRQGDGIDGRRLGKMLKPYGIKSKNIKIDGKVPKGYAREQFVEAWERYTPDPESVCAQDAADDALPALLRYQGSKNGSVEPKTEVADNELLSATYPLPPDPALQSPNGGSGSGVAAVADEVRPSARAQNNGSGWTDEAADAFIQKAIELFPGSVDEPATGSRWVPRAGPGAEPTPAQCADPYERQRLWREHGVRWVKHDEPRADR